MSMSRSEINFKRLCHICEDMVSKPNYPNWKLKAYIHSLDTYLIDMANHSTFQPLNNNLIEYKTKLQYLRSLLKADAIPLPFIDKEPNIDEEYILTKPPNDLSLQVNTLYRSCIEDQANELRKRLFECKTKSYSNANPNVTANPSIGNVGGDEKNILLSTHKTMQNDLMDQMSTLVGNLKSNVNLAGQFIRKDNQVLEESSLQQSHNINKLQSANILMDATQQKANSLWTWILLATVFGMFILMIAFIKLFNKTK